MYQNTKFAGATTSEYDPETVFVLPLFGSVTVPIFIGVGAFFKSDTDDQEPKRRDDDPERRPQTVTRRFDDVERQVEALSQQADAGGRRIDGLDSERI
ncbi:MAG: hypothetical protein ABEI27_01610 [Halobellus sp.]|uniref:hypothetical protein n=1 Tax=Halobellus sp. TaxID=1979212 RepID=UPI0035D50D67